MSDTPKTDEMAQKWDAGLLMPSDLLTAARELERENAALREDKERIEWSEKFLHHVSEVVNPKMDGTRFVGQYRDSTGRETRWMTGRSFRDCIDAARKEAQP